MQNFSLTWSHLLHSGSKFSAFVHFHVLVESMTAENILANIIVSYIE